MLFIYNWETKSYFFLTILNYFYFFFIVIRFNNDFDTKEALNPSCDSSVSDVSILCNKNLKTNPCSHAKFLKKVVFVDL